MEHVAANCDRASGLCGSYLLNEETVMSVHSYRPLKDHEPIMGYGIIISPLPTAYGNELVFAELYPATPLLPWPKPKGQAWYHWLRSGRSWKEPHIRWWFEVSSRPGVPEGDGIEMHHWEHDGGGVTFAGAVSKAMAAVSDVIDDLENEVADNADQRDMRVK